MHPLFVIGGLAAAALIYTKTVAQKKEVAPPATTPGVFTPKDFNLSRAIQFVLDTTGRTLTVRPGTSIQFSKTVGGLAWADPGVVSSNDSVLAPSVPTTITGFVALKEGAVEVKGYYFDDSHELAVLKANVIVSSTA